MKSYVDTERFAVGKITGIHNGLITNESEIHNNHPSLGGETGIDSKTIFQLIDKHIEKGLKIPTAIVRSFEELEGTAAIAFFREQETGPERRFSATTPPPPPHKSTWLLRSTI